MVVRARVLESDDGGTVARFEVHDTGVGVPADLQDSIFEPFSQADSSTTRRFGGTGLGLTITRQFVELMGGTCGMETEPGAGSCFWFTTRLGGAGRELAGGGRFTAGPPYSLECQISILLVEDIVIHQKVAQAMLRRGGHKVDWAFDGVEAVAASMARSYDIVLMNCQMPRMDGMEVTRRIRGNEVPGTPISIVAMTAGAMQEDKDRCLEAGIDDLLAKPVRS